MSRKKTRRWLSLLLSVLMLLSMLPTTVFAANGGQTDTSNDSDFMRIVHLDAGRKYFSVEWVESLIDEMAEDGYTHLELAFGNDGLRFLLDDMSIDLNDPAAVLSRTYTVNDDTATLPAEEDPANEPETEAPETPANEPETPVEEPETEEPATPEEEPTTPEQPENTIAPQSNTPTSFDSNEVKNAILEGNAKYNSQTSSDAWSQSEMDAIIDYAKDAGIEIIPLLNTPGHMDAILYAMIDLGITDAAYNNSVRTIDVTNEDAVAFTQALVEKYVKYFESKDCTYFNMGADEYANDTSGGPKFAELQNSGKYDDYANYINGLASIIKDAGMTPMAFNDGIYYNERTSYGTFDKDIVIAYWSCGWNGYDVASASWLRNKGFKLINTHGDFYYISRVAGDNWDKGTDYADNWDNNTFMARSGSSGYISDPKGAMFCIWCDEPAYEDASVIAKDVIDGGILSAMAKAMGATPAVEEDKPVTDEATGISVTAPGLTEVTVAKHQGAINIPGAKQVVAYDITPATESGDYIGSATVSIPVPEGWNTENLGAFVREQNGSITPIGGAYSDDAYTFTVPHFSVVGIVEYAELQQVNVDLSVGQSSEPYDVPDGTTVDDIKFAPEGIATAEVAKNDGETKTYYELVANGVNGIESGEKYLIVSGTSDEQYALTSSGGAEQVEFAGDGSITSAPSGAVFTLTRTGNTGNGYYLKDQNERYLYPNASYSSGWIGGSWSYSLSTNQTRGQAVTISGSSYVTFSRSVTSGRNGTKTSYISYSEPLELWGSTLSPASFDADDSASQLYLYKEVEIQGDDKTTVTFHGVSEGTTFVIIGDTQYNITVTQDYSDVEDLTIEYWITNGRVVPENGNNTSTEVQASDVYSEDGVTVESLVPSTGQRSDTGDKVRYWRARLLSRPNEVQDTEEDQSLKGTGFTKIRYWEGEWSVYTENNKWVNVTADQYQLVAYYMNDMDLAEEVNVGTSDWGKKGDGTNAGSYLGPDHVSLSFQVIYEDGTKVPATTSADDLQSYTYLVDDWTQRGVGTIVLSQIGDYQIYKVTAETGKLTTEYNGGTGYSCYVTGFNWYDNETEVYNGDPVSEYIISNPARDPSMDGAYANLTWNAQNKAILIRIYVQTVETPDSLNVKYVDSTANNTQFYEYHISVKQGILFDEGIDLDKATEDSWKGPLVNGTVENNLGVDQTVTADLDEMPRIPAQYRGGQYECVEVERSEDGKTVTLYYEFDNISRFVIDFGLPLNITVGDLGLAESGNWTITSVTNGSYGDASVAGDKKSLTYTPDQVLPRTDTITATLQSTTTDEDGTLITTTTSRHIYIIPASNVLYEDSFLSENTSVGTSYKDWIRETASNILTQKADNTTLYGYDTAYANSTDNSLDSAWIINDLKSGSGSKYLTTTFTGTGFDLIGTAGPNTGYVYMMLQGNGTNKLIVIDTSYTDGSNTTLYQVPLAHVAGLTQGDYTVNIRAAYRAATSASSGSEVVSRSASAASSFNSADVYAAIAEMEQDGFTIDEVEYVSVADTLAAASADSSLQAVSNGLVSRAYTGARQEGTTVTIDGFRVYRDATDENYQTAYAEAGENEFTYVNILEAALSGKGDAGFNTIAYVEGDDENYTQANYETSGGPQNELYLKPNAAVVISVSGGSGAQISARAVSGDAAMQIGVEGQDMKNVDLKSNTEMYYKVSDAGGIIVVKNNGNSLIALGNLKVLGGGSAQMLSDADLVVANTILRSMSASAPSEPEEPEATVFTPAKLDVKTSSVKVIFNKVVTVSVSASTDVDKLTINGKTVYPANSLLI